MPGRHVRAAVGVSALPPQCIGGSANVGASERVMREHTLSAEPNPLRVGPLAQAAASTSSPATKCRSTAWMQAAGRLRPGMTSAEYLSIDRTRIHALTGPIWIDGAEPGRRAADRCAGNAPLRLGLVEHCRGSGLSERALPRAVSLPLVRSKAKRRARSRPLLCQCGRFSA